MHARKHIFRLIRQRRFIRYSLLALNVIVLAGIILFIARSTPALSTSADDVDTSSATSAVDPLDQLSSADIAVSLAQMAGLPETTAVTNQAQSVSAELAMTPATTAIIAKPQAVTTDLKSRADIFTYVTQTGDTLASLAAKFGVTSNSIAWSNGLTTASTLNPGTKLTIPPVNGIVYTVKSGDTAATLAAKYQSNEAQIVAYNDAEISGLTPGEEIIIPDGQEPAPTIEAPLAVGSFTPAYGYNGYDFGFCTWYVATQISVPTNWGNAATWAYYAALSGWNVSSTPSVGAIAQTPYAAGGEGHVAIVIAVSPDGSQVEIRDMNGLAGFDRVGTGWVSTSEFPHYITH